MICEFCELGCTALLCSIPVVILRILLKNHFGSILENSAELSSLQCIKKLIITVLEILG